MNKYLTCKECGANKLSLLAGHRKNCYYFSNKRIKHFSTQELMNELEKRVDNQQINLEALIKSLNKKK